MSSRFTVLLCLSLCASAWAAPIDDRMTLVEAIAEVRALGHDVSYSSRLVKDWMRVRQTPDTDDAIEALNAALQAYNLGLESGPDGRWLVVHSEKQNAARMPILIEGRVVDSENGLALPGATIDTRARRRPVVAAVDGAFRLDLLASTQMPVTFSAPGYRPRVVSFDPGVIEDDVVVGLEPLAPPTIEEIMVVASHHSLFSRDVNTDQFLSGDEIRLMPHIGDDAFRAFHRLPGVAAGDFRAPFNLRGGAVDEVVVKLDGLEIIEPFHMRTLYQPLSIIDPGIIGQAEVYSGGFTAEHGNYMSGVVDIETRTQRSLPAHEVGVSFVSAFARSGGDFAGGRGNYFASVRRGYLDVIVNELENEGEELEPRYADAFAKVAYDVTPTLGLSVSTLLANDDVEFVDTLDGEAQREDSEYAYLWLSADYEPNDRVSSRTMFFAGDVESTESGSKLELPGEDIRYFDQRKLTVTGVQTDWTLRLGERQLLLLGARYRDLEADFDYRLNALRTTIFVNNGLPFLRLRDVRTTSQGEDAAVYASYRFRPYEPLTVELGTRWDRQTWLGDAAESQVSPRFNLRYELGERAELRLAWGRFFQPQAIQDLQVEDGETAYHGVERAEHRVVGIRYRLDGGRTLQLDLYDKRYDALRRRYENILDVYEFAAESNFDRVPVDPQSGRAYGAELTLTNRGAGNVDWWLNYSWSKAEDSIDDVVVPRSWDQRHALTANLTRTGEKWTFSATARYRSGWPRTPLIANGIFDASGNLVGVDSDLSRRNVNRYDDYARLDLRLSRFVALNRGSFEYYFELYNVFDTKNQCCVTHHDLAIGTTVSASPEFDDFLPRFPSFGFIWRFGSGAD